MINLFVEFGQFHLLNMEALLDFELIEKGTIFNIFQARNITIILTMFRQTKMLENMIIFIPEKVLIYTCVEMPVMPVIFLLNFFTGAPNVNFGKYLFGRRFEI